MPPAAMPFFEQSGKATRSGTMPGEDGSDKEREKLERKHTELIYRALQQLMHKVVPAGTTVDNITPEEAVNRYREHESILRDAMVAMLTDGAMLGADVGRAQVDWLMGVGKAATITGVDWDLINEDVLAWVMGGGALGGNQFGQGYANAVTAAMATTSERQLRTLIGEWVRNDLTYRQLVDDLSRTVFSRSRAEMLSVTEITRSFFRGNIESWRRYGITRFRMRTAFDERVCGLCGPMNGQEVELDGPLVHPDSGAQYFGLPIHPRCRCFASPVASEPATRQPVATQPPELTNEQAVQPETSKPLTLRYKPSQQQVDRVLKKVDQSLQQVATNRGLSVDELTRVVDETFKRIAAESKVVLNFHSKNVDTLLADGRFKSQFETGTSGAILNTKSRANAEELGLGVPERARAKNRPIYGYLRTNRDFELQGFGDITFVMRDSVKNRTTVTAGDSLYDFAGGVTTGTPINNPTRTGWGQYIGDIYDYGTGQMDGKTLMRRMQYFEAQMQNGITLNDVSHVIDRKGVLSPSQLNALKERGIQVWNSD